MEGGLMNRYIEILLILPFICSLFFMSRPVMAESSGNEIAFQVPLLQKGELVRLTGEWEFYWEELYEPGDFLANTPLEGRKITSIPHHSYGYEAEEGFSSKTGYGTYRLILQFAEEDIGEIKAIYVPALSSAYKVWVGGELKTEVGKVGTSRERMNPNYLASTIPFRVSSKNIEIIVQSSNFYQRKAGMYDPILLGDIETILQHKTKKTVFRALTVASLVIIGLYHLFMFSFYRRETSIIYFGLLCLFVGLRSWLVEEELYGVLFTSWNWEFTTKLEYFGTTFGIAFLSLFTYKLFFQEMNKYIVFFIVFVVSIISLVILATPAIFYTNLINLLFVIVFFTAVYLLYVYFLALVRKRVGAFLHAAAMMILFATAMNDILYFSDNIYTTELTSAGLLVFIFGQAVSLSKRFANEFSKNEKLSRKLKELNASLEELVNERTEQLKRSNTELRIMNEKLNQTHKSRSKLISDISHEVATPLTNILAYTKGMLDGVVPVEKKYIELVYDKSMYLSKMLGDLRSLLYMEAKQVKFEMKRVNIRQYINEFYEKNKYSVEEQGIKFTIEDKLAQYQTDFFVNMDEIRIEQVLLNFLSNAQRFVQKGGKGKITLIVSKQEENILIELCDNGTGIKEEDLPFVFDRFFSRSSEHNEHGGAGLGLAISKEMIENHKGQIGATSVYGSGSCFYFTLPIAKE